MKQLLFTMIFLCALLASGAARANQSGETYPPLTKQDFAAMQRDYVDYDPETRADVVFTEWARIDIGDPKTELIWLRDPSRKGAIYQRKDGQFEKISALQSIDKVLAGNRLGMGVLCIGHPTTNDGDSWWYDCHAFSDGAELWVFFKAVDFDEITSCMINGKQITMEQGQAYEAVLPELAEAAPAFHPIAGAVAGNASNMAKDANLLPMFVRSKYDNELMLSYWASSEEPLLKSQSEIQSYKAARDQWAKQEQFRKNKAAYTNLFLENGQKAKVKYLSEQLADLEGNEIAPGRLHYSPEMPNCAAYLKAIDANIDIVAEKDGVIVTDEYLKGHQPLAISDIYSSWKNDKSLPTAVVSHLEQKYGMKAARSVQLCRIGDRYSYGFVQFEGEWKDAPGNLNEPGQKHCLAVDVLVDGDKIYTHEQIGSYDAGECCWNEEDEGKYIGRQIVAAFDGLAGPELCFVLSAVYSIQKGIYNLRGDKLDEVFAISLENDN